MVVGTEKERERAQGERVSALRIAPSPHIRSGRSTREIMWAVNASLLPIILTSIYYFGISALLLIATSIAGAMMAESLGNYLKKERSTLSDGSALLTGLLLALTLPPALPPLQAFIGAVFSILIGKQIFGGLGYNIFNPALLGRAFLQASFPIQMTAFHLPVGGAIFQNLDGVTAATALSRLKFESHMEPLHTLFLGNTAGSLGETSAVMIMLSASVLLYKKYMNYAIPLSIFVTVAIIAFVTHALNAEKFASPLFHLFSGGMMLGALFMATDMVTSPVTSKGMIIYGIGIALFTMLIRLGGGLSEGFMYATLMMNALTPLINRSMRPTYYGEAKG
jgi:electron transport complex protein RnfD